MTDLAAVTVKEVTTTTTSIAVTTTGTSIASVTAKTLVVEGSGGGNGMDCIVEGLEERDCKIVVEGLEEK